MNTPAAPQPAPVKRRGLRFFYIVISLVLLSVSLYLIVRLFGLNAEKNRLAKGVQTVERVRSETESIKNRRLDYYQGRFLLEIPLRQSFAAADFLRRLSLTVTGDLVIHKLVLAPCLQSLDFELEISVPALRGQAARRLINSFLVRLRQFPDLLVVGRAEAINMKAADEGLAAARNWIDVKYSVAGTLDVE